MSRLIIISKSQGNPNVVLIEKPHFLGEETRIQKWKRDLSERIWLIFSCLFISTSMRYNGSQMLCSNFSLSVCLCFFKTCGKWSIVVRLTSVSMSYHRSRVFWNTLCTVFTLWKLTGTKHAPTLQHIKQWLFFRRTRSLDIFVADNSVWGKM